MCGQIRKAIGLLLLMVVVGSSGSHVLAHGGEDHGGTQPKAATTEKGSLTYTARVGELEVMIKHPILQPDIATEAQLFITKYQTNEAADKVTPSVEIESANGAVTQITAEKADTAGTYHLKIPALPEGAYTFRAHVNYAGETDTATFSGVRVEHPSSAADNGISWLRTIILGMVAMMVLALFAGLAYFVWRFAEGGDIRNDTVSA